jgi:hypothetical protein
VPGECPSGALRVDRQRRRPALEIELGLFRWVDESTQFVSLAFGQQARAAGIAQSMGSRATASITPSLRASSRR